VKPPTKPGVKPVTGVTTVVGAGETILAFTGIGGLTALVPGALLLLILGIMLLVFVRRPDPETGAE
jgi:hypothetical protein